MVEQMGQMAGKAQELWMPFLCSHCQMKFVLVEKELVLVSLLERWRGILSASSQGHRAAGLFGAALTAGSGEQELTGCCILTSAWLTKGLRQQRD